MSTHSVFWQDKPGVPGTFRAAAIPSKIKDSELVIKVHAWAINPCDHMLQDKALPIVQYPVVLGEDVAGVVHAVGAAAASKFQVGDRVVGLAQPTTGDSVHGGFQEYVVANLVLTCKIPNSLSFADASVFPLCMTTAAFALFSNDYLGLTFPTLNPVSHGQSVLIWGGSSSVGSNGIQLAKAAGFQVFTTCSPRNFDYVKGLGADKAFDHSGTIDDIVAEIDKTACAGIYHAAGKVAQSCQVSHKSKQKLFVASSNPVMDGDAPEGVEAKMTFGTGGLEMYAEILPATFGHFLPEALNSGLYKIAPPPQVVATSGINGIQEALNILRRGVSAKKVVVVDV